MTDIIWKIIVVCTDEELDDFINNEIFGIDDEGVYWKKKSWTKKSLQNGTKQ